MINFLFGIIFLVVILPMLESISSIIALGFEVIKAKLSLKISKINSQIQEHQQGGESRAIGFQIYEEDIEEDDEIL